MKRFGRYILISIIVLVIYNVLIFGIPFFDKQYASFWFLWIFGLLANLSQPLIALFAFRNSKNLKSKIYGLPIITLGYSYFIFQMIFTFVGVIINSFFELPLWIVLCIEIIIIGLFLIGLIIKDTYKEEVLEIENNNVDNTKFIRELRNEAYLLYQSYSNSKFGSIIEKLYEEIRFSDPVSSTKLNVVEQEIEDKFNDLKLTLNKNDEEKIRILIDELFILLSKRNNLAKMSKK